jgi:hypothetical protein
MSNQSLCPPSPVPVNPFSPSPPIPLVTSGGRTRGEIVEVFWGSNSVTSGLPSPVHPIHRSK